MTARADRRKIAQDPFRDFEDAANKHFKEVASGKLNGHWLPDKTSDNLPNENTWENGGKRPTGDNITSKQAVAGSSPVSRSTRRQLGLITLY
jgi:hypothetical protein